MNPTMMIPIFLSAMLLVALFYDRRHSERDVRAEENSVAAGVKKWLVGNHDPLPPAPADPVAVPNAEKTLLRVSGCVPPESWDRLGSALLANLPRGAQVSAALDVSFAIDADQIQAVTANLNYLISELDLSGLRIARVDPVPVQAKPFLLQPARRNEKSRPWRVVIRFRDVNPLLQTLLCVNRWPAPSRAAQL